MDFSKTYKTGLAFLLIAALMTPKAHASTHADNNKSSPFLLGPLGLNAIPNARMDAPGTLRAGVSTLDPYAHSWLGFQLAAPLYVQLRQSAEISSLRDSADQLYPGLDVKWRLLEEARHRPELALGLQSALGHKRMAGEYLVASKRYHDFDFTAGLGWGRYAGHFTFDNPLNIFGNHFDTDRSFDGEESSEPADWFTGRRVGLLAGVEYFTPLDGLSVKFDLGGDSWRAERATFDFDAPAPWSAGISYTPLPWISMGIGTQGLDKIMARLSLSTSLDQWPKPGTGNVNDTQARLTNVNLNGPSARAGLTLSPDLNTPAQIGHAARALAKDAGPNARAFTLMPSMLGLRGPAVTFLRSDFENALRHNRGSAAEIWRNTTFDSDLKDAPSSARFLNTGFLKARDFKLVLDQRLSLSEEDSGLLTRTSLVAGQRGPSFLGFVHTGYALRFNLHDNLDNIRGLRAAADLPVRSDIYRFADNPVAVDELYATLTHSLTPDLHMALTGGYLEETYAGLGGEMLYRPFKARWAVGVELWQAFKRDPEAPMAMDLSGDHLLTGHVNGWLDLPETDLTLHARAGRYLAEDVGATLGVLKAFDNGAKLEGYVTLTNQSDTDFLGGTSHAHHGIRLSLPLGGIKHIPRQSSVQIRAEPVGRDAGQALENPVALYALTDPLSYPHLIRHWNDVIK